MRNPLKLSYHQCEIHTENDITYSVYALYGYDHSPADIVQSGKLIFVGSFAEATELRDACERIAHARCAAATVYSGYGRPFHRI
jgi:hypothetical protein